MRRALLLLGLVVALWPAQGHAERRVALVVGNAAYQHAPKLPNPPNDAAAITELLRRAGFDVVETKTDVASVDFKRLVRDFANTVRDADIAVMYFAGHGIEIGGTNYLIPTDAKLASDLDAEDEAVSLERVVRILEPARRLRLVILDACRDNPFLTGMRRSIATRAVTRGLAQVEPATSDTLVAFAAKAGSTAEDGRESNSPFTTALLKHITVPGLDVRIAFGRVRDEVLQTTSRRQEPFVYGSLGGATVALVPEPKVESATGPTPAVNPVADPSRDYELAERVGNREAWDSFLAVHTDGFHANLARAARAKLAAPVQTAPPPPVQAALAVPVGPATLPEPTRPPAEPKIAALPPAAATPPAAGPLARQLQAELKRVGCDPGSVDGDWSGKSRQALASFNKHAGTRFEVKAASLEAIEGVRARTSRICPVTCGRGTRAEGDTCVAIREPASEPRPRERKVHEPVTRREPPARRETVAPAERRPARTTAREAKPAGAGPVSPLCQSSFTGAGGRRCCTYDPPGGAPRIICQ
jgi:hypothetical protein